MREIRIVRIDVFFEKNQIKDKMCLSTIKVIEQKTLNFKKFNISKNSSLLFLHASDREQSIWW